MAGVLPESTRGILDARTAFDAFRLTKIAPSPDLASYVEYYWVLAWDLRGRDPHRQQILTRPAVHMTFTHYLTSGRRRARIMGVVRDEFAERIHDEGHVVGAGFLPGGFRPFLGAPVSTITGRELAVDEVFGDAGRVLAEEVFESRDTAKGVELLESFLLERRPAVPDPRVEGAARILRRVASHPELVRVDDLAAGLGVGARSLQRLFHEYVGVGPKWVIRRYRMLEAAERAASGADIDWSALAAELGYADQPHFTRDFTAAVGTSPARYARRQSGHGGGSGH